MDKPGLMLDPSLFLSEPTLASVRQELERSQESVYVPERFLTLAGRQSFVFGGPSVGAFFGADQTSEHAAALFRDWASSGLLVPYDSEPSRIVSDDQVARRLTQIEVVGNQKIDDDIRMILLQEWSYLKHESWIAARLDACAKAFENAGAASLELTKNAFDAVIDQAQEVPELLRKPGVRRSAKWVLAAGVGAGAIAAVWTVFPPAGLGAALLTSVAHDAAGDLANKAFLKFDP